MFQAKGKRVKDSILYACGTALLLLLGLIPPGVNLAMAQQAGAATARPAASCCTTVPQTSESKPSDSPVEIHTRATERAIDASIPDDPAVDAMLAPYSPKVRALNVVIGRLAADLKKEGMGGGSLGNFVADAIRASAQSKLGKSVPLAITNTGGLRKDVIGAGDLRALDIFDLLPFENALVTVDLTSEQLLRFLGVIATQRDAQSGALLRYRTTAEKKNELINAKLIGPGGALNPVDPAAIYTIVTSDYLVKRGGNYAVLKEGRNVRPLDLTLRDAVLECVKAETAAGRPIKPALDGRFISEETGTAKTEGKQ